jgi:hypothetical protein
MTTSNAMPRRAFLTRSFAVASMAAASGDERLALTVFWDLMAMKE